MAFTYPHRTATVAVRLKAHEKDIVEAAARAEYSSLSEFARAALLDRAKAVIEAERRGTGQ